MIDRKDALIGIGVAAGAAVLVLFLKSGSSSSAGNSVGGGNSIAGGFATAGTVYVPTTETIVNYNQYKGAVSYQTTTNNSATTATTTFSNSPGAGVFTGKPIIYHQPPTAAPSPVHVTTSGGGVTNPPTQQTGTKPTAPAPHAPAPKPPKAPAHTAAPAWEGALQHSSVHYATPHGGWNQGSVVDNLKSNGYNSSMTARASLAKAMGIQNYKGTASQNVQMLNNLKHAGK